MHKFIIFLLIDYLIAFELLPYIQIDYSHYLRLAKCQSKCAQKVKNLKLIYIFFKYAFHSTKRLMDGSFKMFQNTSTDLYETVCFFLKKFY